MGPSLPFTTVENDPDIAPVLEVSAQLFVPVQTAAGDYEEEHVSDSMSRIAAGLRVIREITHPRSFDRFPPGTLPSGGDRFACQAVTVAAVAQGVSVAAVAAGVWASGAGALEPSSHVASLRDFVSRDPS